MKKKAAIFLVVLLAVSAGFLRDSFFVHLNAQIGVADGYYSQFDLPFLWEFLEGLNTASLFKLKWAFTIIFFLIFFAIGLLIVRWFFPSKKNYLITLFAFGGVLVLSGIAIFAGKISGAFGEQSYYFARWLMGAGQSPLLIMILALLFYADQKGIFQHSAHNG